MFNTAASRFPDMRPHIGKAVNITITIEEGEQYRMGTLKIVSADPDKALVVESRMP